MFMDLSTSETQILNLEDKNKYFNKSNDYPQILSS